jgi:hypothetical protein
VVANAPFFQTVLVDLHLGIHRNQISITTGQQTQRQLARINSIHPNIDVDNDDEIDIWHVERRPSGSGSAISDSHQSDVALVKKKPDSEEQQPSPKTLTLM